MNLPSRILRHARITLQDCKRLPSPPLLVLFISSICNMRCEHCFYWRNLNRRDDLTRDEIFSLSRSLGRIENLNLSGGEPFLRKEFVEICLQFIRQNRVRQIYVPTNGWYTDRIVEQVSLTLEEPGLDLFVVELSLDGMGEYHDRFRGTPGSFERAMESYDALALLQERDSRLRIHANTTAVQGNLDEIRRLTTFLYERCPKMDHHNLAIIRGDHKDPSLTLPSLDRYRELYEYIRLVWASRESRRYGAIVEPILQWAKLENIERKTQVIPCRAGRICAVVYANGDVGVCELRRPLGNLRERSFWEIWSSETAWEVRRSIADKECHCSAEVFLWPSIVYQPLQLAHVMVSAKIWRR